MSEYVLVCSRCGSTGQPEEVATQWWEDGRPCGWEIRCPDCHVSFGVRLDGGTLDLGLVRDTVTDERNDFQIFPEEPQRS